MIYNPISVYPQPLNVTTLPRYCVTASCGALMFLDFLD